MEDSIQAYRNWNVCWEADVGKQFEGDSSCVGRTQVIRVIRSVQYCRFCHRELAFHGSC